MSKAEELAKYCEELAGEIDHTYYTADLLESAAELRRLQAENDALKDKMAQQDAQGVPGGWQPTAENINSLPEPIRHYIAGLETNADPSGTVRDLTIARDTVRALEASNRMLRDSVAELEAKLAQQDAQPVAVIGSDYQLLWVRRDWSKGLNIGDLLYTRHAPKQVPLDHVQRFLIIQRAVTVGQAIDMVEAAHGITGDKPSAP